MEIKLPSMPISILYSYVVVWLLLTFSFAIINDFRPRKLKIFHFTSLVDISVPSASCHVSWTIVHFSLPISLVTCLLCFTNLLEVISLITSCTAPSTCWTSVELMHGVTVIAVFLWFVFVSLCGLYSFDIYLLFYHVKFFAFLGCL